MKQAIDAIERWAGRGGGAAPEPGIDRLKVVRDVPVGDIDAGDLASLPALEIEVAVEIRVDSWHVAIRADPASALQITESGQIEAAIDQDDVDDFRAAVETNNVADVLAALGSRRASVTLTYKHPAKPAGFHWVHSASVLEDRLADERWLATLHLMFDGDGPHTVVANDAGASFVRAPAFAVRGPDADGIEAGPEERTDAHERFLAERGRPDESLPSPVGLAPVQASGMESLEQVTTGIARVAAWYWLAREVVSADPPPTVRFVGSRLADVELLPKKSKSAKGEIALYQWALPGEDPLQDEAVQQAAALAIFSPNDVETAAGPVLRNAQTVLRALRKDEVSEALATQRTVRESAIKAGGAAADAGRTAGTKVLERVIVQAAAAAGILIANHKQAIPDHIAGRLLLLVALLVAASTVLAFVVEYPMARGIVTSFKTDLTLHEDTLSRDAIEEIKNMQALEDAGKTIDRSWWTSVVVMALASVALIVAGATLL